MCILLLSFFSSVTWRIHTCGMTHSYVWHDSFICMTWLFIGVTWPIHMRILLLSFSSSAIWLVRTCAMTHLYAWHDSFIWLTLPIHVSILLLLPLLSLVSTLNMKVGFLFKYFCVSSPYKTHSSESWVIHMWPVLSYETCIHYVIWKWGFCRKVIPMQWDCGKNLF